MLLRTFLQDQMLTLKKYIIQIIDFGLNTVIYKKLSILWVTERPVQFYGDPPGHQQCRSLPGRHLKKLLGRGSECTFNAFTQGELKIQRSKDSTPYKSIQ